MKRIFLFLTLLTTLAGLGCAVADAQQSTSNSQVRISGTIADSVDKQPIAFATVAITLRVGDTEEEYGQVTDNQGYFRIALPQAEKYRLQCSYVGKKFTPMEIKHDTSTTDIKLGKIYMTDDESTQLEEVKVVSARPLVKMGIDRLSYAMKEDREAPTKSLLDMLRKVPLVTVDGQGNIQVKGLSNFRIFLNGKPSPIFDQDPKTILRSIPAATIKSVEVITDPGVKYDAEGVGAIINIVTDVANGDGILGNISLTAGHPWFGQGGIYLAAKKGKWGLSTNLNGYTGSIDATQNRISQLSKQTDLLNKTILQVTDGSYAGLIGNLLLSYEINESNLLTTSLVLRPNKMGYTTNGRHSTYRQKNLIEQHSSLIKEEQIGGSIQAGIDYQYSTKVPNELLTLSYRLSFDPNSSEAQNTFFQQGPGGANLLKKAKTDAGLTEHTAQIDYVRPFAERHNVEIGAKFIHRSSSAKPSYTLYDNTAQIWKPQVPTESERLHFSDFLHHYNIWAGYLAYTYKQNRYSAKAGARVEGGQLNVEYKDLPKANYKDNFFNWIPEVSLEYKPTDNQQIKASYNFYIKRPHISQLNPYVKETSLVHEQGNPNLKPSKNHSAGLSYSLFRPTFSLMLSANYNYTQDIIHGHYEQKADRPGILFKMYDNFGLSYGPNFSTYINYAPTGWLRLSLNASASYSTWKAKQINLDHSDWGYQGHFHSQFSLPKDWTIGCNIGLYNAGRQLQSISETTYYNNFDISKSLLQQRLNLGIGISNPFKKEMTFRKETDTQSMNLITEDIAPTRYVYFSVAYRFGSLSTQVKKTVRSITNNDLDSGAKQQQQGGIQAGM
ncbi:MAG: TonB-dependent receptor [Porphyromonas sp.]|nr:TonB-dependent receptor [Porphyromonas sp.]